MTPDTPRRRATDRPAMAGEVRSERWVRTGGVLAALVLVASVASADLLEGPRPAYVGVLTFAPFLAAVFAQATDVLGVGLAALATGHGIGLASDAAATHPQLVRLAFLVLATALAVTAAQLRQTREAQLAELRGVAEATQSAILRQPPALVGSLALAARYRSASSAARVGGDFFDVVSGEHGVRLVVGDVRGKGLEAVRLSAAVLGAFREAAAEAGPDLRDVARALSRCVAREAGLEDFVTAVLVQVDADGRCWVTSCGHPPALHVTRTGEVVELRPSRPCAPLGLMGDPVLDTLLLAPGERLLLYTDGLTEARDARRQFFDLDRAARGLASGSLDEAADALLADVQRHAGTRIDDDLALLLVEQQARPVAPRVPAQASRGV